MIRRVAAVLAGVALALSACGGSSTGARQDSPGPTGGGESAEFKSLGGKAADAKIKVTFRATQPGGKSYEVTLSQDPPRRSYRIKQDSNETLLIAGVDGSLITCSSSECVKMSGMGSATAGLGGAFLGPFSQGLDALKSLTSIPGFVSKGSKTIAGRAAICATWSPPFAQGSVEQCLDRETGMALSWTVTAAGSGASSMEATEIGTPSESDFTPTHTVREIPTGFPTSFPTT